MVLYALKGQKHLAQGNTLGYHSINYVALKGQKHLISYAFALSGRLFIGT